MTPLEKYLRELEEIRKSCEEFGAIHPIQIPYSDLKSRETRVLIEYFGPVLFEQTEAVPNITKSEFASFMINIMNLSQDGLLSNDNHFNNITYDKTNGLRLIDTLFDNCNLIRCIPEGDYFKWLIRTMMTEQQSDFPDIKKLLRTNYKDLTEEQIQIIKSFFESFL